LETADFDYALPPEQIAIAPAAAREDARLLVLDRVTGERKHVHFRDVVDFLPRGAPLVLNDTRVFPARLRGRRRTGGACEFLLTRRVGVDAVGAASQPGVRSGAPNGALRDAFEERWEALARGLGNMRPGTDAIDVGGGVRVELLERRDAGRVLVAIMGPGPALAAVLDEIGEVPLPPYIEAARRERGGAPAVDDRERYQTVYAAETGAVAAPTAGLHFSDELLGRVRAAGHPLAFVTLHVGPGTFRPVEVADPTQHRLDPEHYRIEPDAAATIDGARARPGGRVIAVGTTVVRALEANARAHGGRVVPEDGETDLFIYPGASPSASPGGEFGVVTDLITNFHLPRSTLLMLVAAFAGREHVLDAYREAIALGYRFYSYGDAMLITGAGGGGR
jgi:S-adenosylmethionine:tRNA ribosyltransferase-isomerase